MERGSKNLRGRYSGDGSPESPFRALGSPDILSFSLEVAKDNLDSIQKGAKIHVVFNEHEFAIVGHPESQYLPEKVVVIYVGESGDIGSNIHVGGARAAVQYSQRFYSSLLMEIIKKELGM